MVKESGMNADGELKPCPFCGSSANPPEDSSVCGLGPWWRVMCSNDCCRAWRAGPSPEEVAAVWNQRARPADADGLSWRPITAEEPPVGRVVFLRSDEGRWLGKRYRDPKEWSWLWSYYATEELGWRWKPGWFDSLDPTHWAPVPPMFENSDTL